MRWLLALLAARRHWLLPLLAAQTQSLIKLNEHWQREHCHGPDLTRTAGATVVALATDGANHLPVLGVILAARQARICSSGSFASQGGMTPCGRVVQGAVRELRPGEPRRHLV